MNIQHIHSQIISCKIHRLENLFQSHFFLVFGQANHRIRLGLQSLFNETQKVFLVHTRGRVDVRVHLHKNNETIESLFLTERLVYLCNVYLSDIIEITMGHSLLCRQLSQFVE